MAARKLQTEIDRTLKKVAEGVELFESIYEKMQSSTNQTQKEKQETDLKTQIKKLQRLRDQIKTWVASNDIKDKSALLDNRRLIETQMEKFKACEKEMKTKAFSKEGLTQSARLDPKAQEKLEVTLWLQQCVEDLTLQVEQAEAEVEALQGGGKKRGKGASSTAGRLDELEHLNERRKWHVSRLELILRLLDNGSLTTERVLALKEDVTYFVESNTEEGFDEDEGLYDDLNLEEEEEKFGLANDDDENSDDSDAQSEDVPMRTPKKHDKDEESVASSSKRDDSPVQKKSGVTLQLRKASLATETAKPPPNPNFAQQPMASILKAGLPPAPRPAATLTPFRYAAAAAAAVSATATAVPSTPSSSQPTSSNAASNSTSVPSTAPSIAPSTSQSMLQDSQLTSSPSLTHPSVTSPMLSSASASHQPDGSFYSSQDSPAISEAVPSSVSGPAASPSPQRTTYQKEPVASPVLPRAASPAAPQAILSDTQQPQANGASQATQSSAPQLLPAGPSPLPQQLQQLSTSGLSTSAGAPSPAQQPQYPPGVKVPLSAEPQSAASSQGAQQQATVGMQRPPSAAPVQQAPGRPTASAFPGSLSDLVASFETVKQKAPHRMNNLGEVHKLLEGGYTNAPQPVDTEKPKYYVPRHPFNTPAFYPQTPNPVLSTPGIFSQIDVETLFYVFYYLPGTYQQYLAAKELKRQSWRFHVKYLTWFQRHSEPQAITEEYEQGVYVYFDWEGSWCQRKKSDFRFEYRYLSED
ncbi:hypothetical protein HYDPIDRAFT_105187 [Hydnomerulius pinastri MD-312]|nr:hypothetical protein HYDPIDRAFT_105187 [Hydnomerulius pinastri MD-312]